MKRYFYILFFLTIGLNTLAQRQMVRNLTTFDDKRLHFGFTLALNALDFDIDHYQTMDENPNFLDETIWGENIDGNRQIRADISTLTPGFTVGIVTNLRMTEYLDLRFLPGMSFGERKLVYNIPVEDNNSGDTDFYSIKSTFLDFPLLVKYKSKRMNNQRPYLIGGVAYRIDISKTGQEDLVRLKPFSSSVEVGVGWDSYLQFFRLSTELKFSFGLSNVLDEGPKLTSSQPKVYTNALSKLTSNMFIFSFHFE
ncbi:MAG: porin family protein [Bacteroidota bacterium]|nr:porin family protein [Bacteroidota bacterium]